MKAQTVSEMFEELDRTSRWKTFSWAVSRFLDRMNPERWYRGVKWFIQRGRRGWADCDVWALDSYLATWLPSALRHLKTNGGIPTCMFDDPEDTSEEASTRAGVKWNGVLDKMIAGFEAYQRAEDGIYEEELGPYPLRRPKETSSEVWEAVCQDRFQKSEALRERDMETFRTGIALFVKHFGSLWD